MKLTLALVLTAALVCTAVDLDLTVSLGPAFSTGQWGRNLGTGIDGRITGAWMITPSLRVGMGIEGQALSSTDGGSASLTMLTPALVTSYYLRPWGNSFNPGVECAFGLCRTSLSNSGGADPVTWDPAWRAGLRWDFSLGGSFRGRIGADYSSVLAEMEQADSFLLLFGFSREVTL